ncbi:Na+/H+ antiporter NhaC family protein [Gillisia hiemivivida]|uniref:Na+/H+ antiporter NhaC family protein n=1 Tax=Gillisia hiemivivida TaxID=291190 RepID=A0A5C6ZTM4_9FLAO|nr:Na+/H+ antiporter NhaC family protein [Gillisia hiemivivida]TXD94085.1 Na+/H+ antiporter NhaC family protein [Gillisia hiemivivida]
MNNSIETEKKVNFYALLPLFLFVLTFLGAGIYLDDFYALPSPIAVILGIVLALVMFKDSINIKIATLLKGCGDDKILTMCLIYLLAGAFTVVCKATGSVDAIVELGLQYISIQWLYAGVFIIAAFLSIATGTSVGAIVALGAVVIGFADTTEVSLAILSASLLGGAMFGDNLSIISDTTIAATQSLQVNMKDKFRQNIIIAGPVAVVTIGILLYQGFALDDSIKLDSSNSIEIIKIVPYLLVLTLAVVGMNVFVVLFIGILAAGILGIYYGDFGLLEFARLSYEGFTSMTEIFLLSLLTGGLAALVTKAGGITFLINFITTKMNSKTAYFGISGLVGVTNMAIANNTVSIIIIGPIAKRLNDRFKLNPKKVASVLDIFACVVQGLLPYGAQCLIILSLADGKIDYLDLVSNSWYLWLLLIGTLLYIQLTSRNTPTEIPTEKELVLEEVLAN